MCIRDRPKIAKEKAGIIKEGVPVVIGRAKGHVKRVFTIKGKKVNAPVIYAPVSYTHLERSGP